MARMNISKEEKMTDIVTAIVSSISPAELLLQIRWDSLDFPSNRSKQ